MGASVLILSTVAAGSVLLAAFVVGLTRDAPFRRNAGLALFVLTGLVWIGALASTAAPAHPERMSLAVASEICGGPPPAPALEELDWDYFPDGVPWPEFCAEDEHVTIGSCVVSSSASKITVRDSARNVVAEPEVPGLAPRSEWSGDAQGGLLLLSESARRTEVWRVDPRSCELQRLNLGRLEGARFEATGDSAVCVTGTDAAAVVEIQRRYVHSGIRGGPRAVPRPAVERWRNHFAETLALLIAFVSTVIGLGFGWGPSRDWYRANQRARALVERLGNDDRPQSYREASGLTVGDLDQLLVLRNQRRKFGWVAADRFASIGLGFLVFVIVPLLVSIVMQRGP